MSEVVHEKPALQSKIKELLQRSNKAKDEDDDDLEVFSDAEDIDEEEEEDSAKQLIDEKVDVLVSM